jgi:aspartate aminotransferase-like enzyme
VRDDISAANNQNAQTLQQDLNGAYGVRMAAIAKRYNIPIVIREWPDTEPCDPEGLRDILRSYPQVTHVAVVHCETTTGILSQAETFRIGSIGAITPQTMQQFVDAVARCRERGIAMC